MVDDKNLVYQLQNETSMIKQSSTNSLRTVAKELTESWLSEQNCSFNMGKINRSRSLTHFSADSYAPGEIRRIKERLLRTNSQIEKSVLSKFNKTQKMTLLSLALVDFMCFCSMSIMAPFFPREAAEKGLSNTLSGFVFSFYALVMFITSPVFGKILPKLGAKFLFLTGIFITGACNILFGLLEYVQNYVIFTVLCFLIRGFEALGASAFSTASYVFVVYTFPESIGSVLGILETFVGLGMSVGPAIGGLLYSLGGFEMPFFVLGIAMVLIIPLNIWLLPSVNDLFVGGEGRSIFKLITVPAVIVTSLVVVVTSSIWGFLDPTLEPHLRQFNLSPEQIGSIFLLFSALYGISSPFWGWLADKIDNHWSMVVWGLLFSTISLLLLGPCPYLTFLDNSLTLNLIALSSLGISVALTLLPTFQSVLKHAIEGGFDDSVATYSLVAGIWSCVYSLGEVVGPSLGGFLLEEYGFPICATVMAALTFFMTLLAFCFFCIKSRNDKHDDCLSDSGISESWQTEDSESTPLLGIRTDFNHRCYIEQKVHHYEQSRKMDHEIGELDRNQVTDIRGMVAVTSKGSCEA